MSAELLDGLHQMILTQQKMIDNLNDRVKMLGDKQVIINNCLGEQNKLNAMFSRDILYCIARAKP